MPLYQVTQERPLPGLHRSREVRKALIDAASSKLAAESFRHGRTMFWLDTILVINLETREAKIFNARASRD